MTIQTLFLNKNKSNIIHLRISLKAQKTICIKHLYLSLYL